MTTSSLSPFGKENEFPDNGIISQAYDSRVSQNDMLRAGIVLMHAGVAYHAEKALSGANIYTWDKDFIAMVRQSINENKVANFSKKQKAVFDQYVVVLTDGLVGNEPDYIVALNTYLGLGAV